jgi:hypothetical protein
MSELQEILNEEVLGHYYNTSEGGGIAKLFYPYAQAIDRSGGLLERIQRDRYLETATARSLDLIGLGIGVGREQDETDEKYRQRLHLEIMVLISQATLEEIRAILVAALGVAPDAILIYNNEAPSQGLTDLPFFCEISLNHGCMLLGGETRLFKFSDAPTTSTYNSKRGFDNGKWRENNKTQVQMLVKTNQWIERILGTGVQYQIAAHGGFKFSDQATVSTFGSDRGFDNGRWRRVMVV